MDFFPIDGGRQHADCLDRRALGRGGRGDRAPRLRWLRPGGRPGRGPSRLEYTFAASGTYYLGISGAGNAGYDPAFAGSGAAGAVGDYRLELSLEVFTPAEFELSRLLAGTSGGRRPAITGTGNYTELTHRPRPAGGGRQSGRLRRHAARRARRHRRLDPDGRPRLPDLRPSGRFPAKLNLNYIDGSAGYVLDGTALGDRVGFTGGGAGDVNHDGIPDLVVGLCGARRRAIGRRRVSRSSSSGRGPSPGAGRRRRHARRPHRPDAARRPARPDDQRRRGGQQHGPEPRAPAISTATAWTTW